MYLGIAVLTGGKVVQHVASRRGRVFGFDLRRKARGRNFLLEARNRGENGSGP